MQHAWLSVVSFVGQVRLVWWRRLTPHCQRLRGRSGAAQLAAQAAWAPRVLGLWLRLVGMLGLHLPLQVPCFNLLATQPCQKIPQRFSSSKSHLGSWQPAYMQHALHVEAVCAVLLEAAWSAGSPQSMEDAPDSKPFAL